MTFQGHGSVRGRNGPDLKSTFFQRRPVSINELLREKGAPKGPHIILLAYGEAGKRVLKFQGNLARFSKCPPQMRAKLHSNSTSSFHLVMIHVAER